MPNAILFQTERKLVINLKEIGHLIETVCEGFLKETPKGIYTYINLEPVMVDGKEYYYKQGTEVVPVTDINQVNTAVYNSDHKIVISSSLLKNKAKFLSNKPFMPYYGIHIANRMVQGYLSAHSIYNRSNTDAVRNIDKYFTDDAFATAETDPDDRVTYSSPDSLFGTALEEVMSDIHGMVFDFMKGHEWNLHCTKLTNSTLVIEQGIDYRVFCWEIEHGDQWRNGKYTTPTSSSED